MQKTNSICNIFILLVDLYRGRRNIKCEPPKTVAPPLTDQTTPINNLCWVLNHSLGLYKWRHQGDFEISTPVQNYSTKTLFL